MIIFGKPVHTHNTLCYVFMFIGLLFIVFGVSWGFIDDTLIGTLTVLCGCAMIYVGWDSRH